MKIFLTSRVQKRIESARRYLENEFYPEYGRNFEDKETRRHGEWLRRLGFKRFNRVQGGEGVNKGARE